MLNDVKFKCNKSMTHSEIEKLKSSNERQNDKLKFLKDSMNQSSTYNR